jgi:tRNA dimethylallyltransferase
VSPRRLAIVGPTASGKSALALQVARRLGDVEIVTVDSMQVYRGMDIGTAKPSKAEQAEVPHHLIDVADPAEEYTLRRFQRAARAVVADIEARGRRPLLVGGTGLYLRAVVDDLEIPARYPEVRTELERRDDLAALYAELRERDPLAASRIEPGNRRRIVRALEVCLGSGRPFSSFGAGLDTYPANDWDVVALSVEPAVLAERIADRYADQIAQGFLGEVRALADAQPPIGRTAAQALGYRQLLAHLAGDGDLDEAVESAVAATRRFARRQRSWFLRDPRLRWCDVTPDGALDALADELATRWQAQGWEPDARMGD